MIGQLFAFRLARPAEAEVEEPAGATYDPEAQVAVWQGDVRPLAIYCTQLVGYKPRCNAYPGYCTTWGTNKPNGYRCDR